MKVCQVLGILAAIALIAFGLSYPVPEKHLYVSSYSYTEKDWDDEFGEEYVGGDAYNYQMEASLKAGYMGGVLAMKSVSAAGGVLLFFASLYSMAGCSAVNKQTAVMKELLKAVEKQNKLFDVDAGKAAESEASDAWKA